MAESKEIQSVNTIRALAADVVQKANSGHPGMPMGMAPLAHVLWTKHMTYNPTNPKWIGRDRFVLSNGHGCALLYSMLHLTGYNVTLDDLKSFRQLGSKTPGHPEAHDTEGVEVTTGPLGQGIANAVGLAAAEAHLAAKYNKTGHTIFDNYTYVFCGDGCLQEGVAAEAASLAGHLGLGKIIVLYDDNKITIDGETNLSFSEDVPARFRAYGWHTSTVTGGDDDLQAISAAIEEAKGIKDKPTLISVKTTIGFGSAKQGTESVHGSPLGDEDIRAVKQKFGLNPDEKFVIPDDVRATYDHKQAGADAEAKWNAAFEAYAKEFPAEAAEIRRRFAGELVDGWEAKLPSFTPADKAVATRSLSGTVLNQLAAVMPELLGGSADLTPSNKTALKGETDFSRSNYAGRYFRFGVREHGMAAIGNGLVAYGGIIPFTATFLNFIEYCFPAVRLTALSQVQQIFIMTHDSIGLGEDGPTHQPIEALTLTRGTPNILTFRPADGNEVTGSYVESVKFRTGPSVLALSRQNLPQLEGSSAASVAKGGYVLQDAKDADLILVGSGSETSLCVEAAKVLAPLKVRVVSMPCTELFDKQSVDYRRSVLTPGVPVISVEALSVTGWERYSHHQIGMRTFGASAPIADVMDHFGFTPAKVAATSKDFLAKLQEASKLIGASKAPLLSAHF